MGIVTSSVKKSTVNSSRLLISAIGGYTSSPGSYFVLIVAMDPFAARLKQALEDWQKRERTAGRRYSQGAFADAIRVERNTVQGWLNRGVVPRNPVVRAAVAQALDVTWAWLAGEEDEEPTKRVAGKIEGEGADSASGVSPAWSQLARTREQELRAEAAKAGLDDEELAAISRTLRDLATAPAFDFGGRPRLLSEEEQLQEVEAVAVALRAWIGVRAKRRRQNTATAQPEPQPEPQEPQRASRRMPFVQGDALDTMKTDDLDRL